MPVEYEGMKRKILLGVALVLVLSTAAAQPTNRSSEVKPGLMPGSFLYPVENFVETIEVRVAGFVGGPDLKAKAIANNAEERLAEARELSEKNRTEKAAEAVEKYSEAMNRSQELASRGEDGELKQKLENVSSRNIQTLEEVKKKVPEEARKGIQNAIDKSKSRRDKMPEAKKQPGAPSRPEKPQEGETQPSKPENMTPGKPDKSSLGNTTDQSEAGNASSTIPKNTTPGNPENSGGSEVTEEEVGSPDKSRENSSGDSGNESSSSAEQFISEYEETGSEVNEDVEVDREEGKIRGGR